MPTRQDATTATPASHAAALRHLARACGVQTSYVDTEGRRRTARPEALIAVLRALGQPIERAEDAPEALRRVERKDDERHCRHVAWNGRLTIDGALPTSGSSARGLPSLELRTEQGAMLRLNATPAKPGRAGRTRLAVGERLPFGVHELVIHHPGGRSARTVYSAPSRCYRPDELDRSLGVFMPLYALRSARSGGCGDLSDLEVLARWTRASGAQWVGTLPLLASFLDEPFDPSPYAPVSRLFWNELFADPAAAPELAIAPEAARLLQSDERCRRVRELGRETLTDYRGVMAAKRPVLDALADATFRNDRAREELEAFARGRAELEDYARFRGAVERHRASWREWPEPQRGGVLQPGDWDEPARRTHLYAQWLLHRQLRAIADSSEAGGLYLDLPIGVNAAGYDVWRSRDQFAVEISVGAPPDSFFREGQDWGFPPLLPDGTEGHACFRAAIRRHLEHAGLLRIDHVMALHRLFWIPHGFPATDGVYVRYPAEELYALLSIESHRARAGIVGENLGTVPTEVNRQLRRRGLLGMHVLQFVMGTTPSEAVPPSAEGTLATLNTHDMPPFAAYWTGADLALRQDLGLLDDAERRREADERRRAREAIAIWLRHRGRIDTTDAPAVQVLRALLEELAEGDADVVLVSLEDLWLETRPQNVPGIAKAFPSWRRPASRTLESIVSGQVDATVRELVGRRRSRPGAR